MTCWFDALPWPCPTGCRNISPAHDHTFVPKATDASGVRSHAQEKTMFFLTTEWLMVLSTSLGQDGSEPGFSMADTLSYAGQGIL